MSDKNPYRICTWDEKADCADCDNQGILHCKWDAKVLTGFIIPAVTFCAIAIFGMVLTGIITGVWWPLIAYAGFWVFFFVFFEIRILCSHCPYYARSGRMLRCLANHGMIKLWRYHPEPMSGFEKISLLICFVIFGAGPVVWQAYGIWFLALHYSAYGALPLLALSGIAGASILGITAFFTVLMVFFCPRCVNFSCPLNRAGKDKVDAYLRRNKVMRDAWEKKGYRLGKEDGKESQPKQKQD